MAQLYALFTYTQSDQFYSDSAAASLLSNPFPNAYYTNPDVFGDLSPYGFAPYVAYYDGPWDGPWAPGTTHLIATVTLYATHQDLAVEIWMIPVVDFQLLPDMGRMNRKNSLFAGHDEGAVNWACLASLIETAKIHGIDPQAYLADTLAKLVNGWPMQKLDELPPWTWADQTRARLAA